MAASRWARAATRVVRQAPVCCPSAPSNCRHACRRCASVSAAMRSARPSTSLRSSLSLSKARRVNSPASAGRNPGNRPRADKVADTTARPPCRCSSATSSPVKLCGAGNQSTRPRSMTSPLTGSRTAVRPAWRGGGRVPVSAVRAAPAPVPDRRTTATPARPGALDRAKMVSRSAALAGANPQSRPSAASVSWLTFHNRNNVCST